MAADEIRRRPERVIILDADDPMTEIEGRFVWQDEHDRVVEETRAAAFAEGYAAGLRDAEQGLQPAALRVEFRRRRTVLSRLKLAILVLGLICFLLVLPVIVLAD